MKKIKSPAEIFNMDFIDWVVSTEMEDVIKYNDQKKIRKAAKVIRDYYSVEER